jgi:hypothetical protein
MARNANTPQSCERTYREAAWLRAPADASFLMLVRSVRSFTDDQRERNSAHIAAQRHGKSQGSLGVVVELHVVAEGVARKKVKACLYLDAVGGRWW